MEYLAVGLLLLGTSGFLCWRLYRSWRGKTDACACCACRHSCHQKDELRTVDGGKDSDGHSPGGCSRSE